MKYLHLALGSLAFLLALVPSGAQSQQELVFVGSGKKNIDAFRFDLSTGILMPLGQAAAIDQPSFLAITSNHRFLYAASEGKTPAASGLSAFAIDAASGKLTFLNRQSAGESGPCYVELDSLGRNALTASYGTGTFSVYPLALDGAIQPVSCSIQDHGSSINPVRQKSPHAHCLAVGPGGRLAYGCDLGVDKVMIFKFNPAKGTLVSNEPAFAQVKPGSGPRHIVFHPNGRWGFLISEMASTITVFAFDSSNGALREIQTESTLPAGFSGRNTAAEVAVHPSGRYVYGSNRGDDSIAVFGFDPQSGRLTFIERVPADGKTPRHLEIDPTGRYLLAADQDANAVVVFRIDAASGRLQQVGLPVQTDNPMCVRCVKFP